MHLSLLLFLRKFDLLDINLSIGATAFKWVKYLFTLSAKLEEALSADTQVSLLSYLSRVAAVFLGTPIKVIHFVDCLPNRELG